MVEDISPSAVDFVDLELIPDRGSFYLRVRQYEHYGKTVKKFVRCNDSVTLGYRGVTVAYIFTENSRDWYISFPDNPDIHEEFYIKGVGAEFAVGFLKEL